MRDERNDQVVYVDMGTTRTRVWLLARGRLVSRASAAAGARDTAREGSSGRVRAALRDLIAEVRAAGRAEGVEPAHVAAAGMIGSAQGLVEVPHVQAPAGLDELAEGVQRHHFPDVTDLDVLLVPGVRTGPLRTDGRTVGTTDVMRGEETLVLGLAAQGLLPRRSVLFNAGSHWKLVAFDEDGCVASSLTSMTGELVHAVQTQTILASALPGERLSAFDAEWLDAGVDEVRRAGPARTLFCVRLLEQSGGSTPEQRFSFLLGAATAADLDAVVGQGLLAADEPVVITGGGAAPAAISHVLAGHGISTDVLTGEQVEAGYLAGLDLVTEPARQLAE